MVDDKRTWPLTGDGRWLRRETQVTRFFPRGREARFVIGVAMLAVGDMMIQVSTIDGKKLELKFDTVGLTELKEAVQLLENERLAVLQMEVKT